MSRLHDVCLTWKGEADDSCERLKCHVVKQGETEEVAEAGEDAFVNELRKER